MSIWDYRDNFEYDEPLGPTDPLHVDLNPARGSYSRDRLYRGLGVNVTENTLRSPPKSTYQLFGGHRGCGKSTELRAIAAELHAPERFFVVLIDALKELDTNNLSYSDIALAQAEALMRTLEENGIGVADVFLTPLRDWFNEVIKSSSRESALSAEVKSGAEISTGLPFIGKLFTTLTGTIRNNTTDKTEIRERVRNSFSQLATHFNALLAHVKEEVVKHGKGRALLFIVDGTDRLSGDEADNLFIRDIHQLRQLCANTIYCAPINILNEQGQVGQNFDDLIRLPMIKLAEKGQSVRIDAAWTCLRQFICKRLPADNFDDQSTLDALIACSGGHPRDLLRLIKYCFQEIDEGPITHEVADMAIKRLSNDYKRLVKPSDYLLLREIDAEGINHTPSTDDTRRLLYDLVLLEYNSYWWQTHPAVSRLPAYLTPPTPQPAVRTP
jgi:hypothetical protein